MHANYLLFLLSLVLVNCNSNESMDVDATIELSKNNYEKYSSDSTIINSISISPENGFYTDLSTEIKSILEKIDHSKNSNLIILNGGKIISNDFFISTLQSGQENFGENILNENIKISIYEIDEGNGINNSKFYMDYDYDVNLDNNELIQKENIGNSLDSKLYVYQTYITVKSNVNFYPNGNKELKQKKVIRKDSVLAVVSVINF